MALCTYQQSELNNEIQSHVFLVGDGICFFFCCVKDLQHVYVFLVILIHDGMCAQHLVYSKSFHPSYHNCIQTFSQEATIPYFTIIEYNVDKTMESEAV